MSEASAHDEQVIKHMTAACRVWEQMDPDSALISLMAFSLSLCEMAINTDCDAGAYLAQRICEMVNERAPAKPGETVQ